MLEIGQEWLLYITPFRMKETTAPTGGAILPNAISLYCKDKSGTSALYFMNDAGTESEIPTGIVTGTGTATRVAFWSASSTLSSSANLYWDNTNNALLVGATTQGTPGSSFEATKSGLSTTHTGFLTTTYATTPNNRSIFSARTARGTSASPSDQVAGDNILELIGAGYSGGAFRNVVSIELSNDTGTVSSTEQPTRITFQTTPVGSVTRAERMRITSEGLVGIGVTPTNPLHLRSGSTAFLANFDQYNASFGCILQFRRALGSVASPSPINAADLGIGRISFAGYHSGSAFGNQVGIVDVLSAESFTSTNQGCYMRLMTTPTGSATIAERFRIGPAGQLGIGGATYGTAGHVLTSGGAAAPPTWSAAGSTPHDLLDGVIDQDTLIGTVVRGDLIVGNSTPKWGRFAKGASGTILQMGANDPAWVALSTITHASWGSQLADDHTQYALLAGRSGGQTLAGGTAAGDDIGLYGTTNGTPTTGTNGSGAIVNIGVNSGATHPIATAYLEDANTGVLRLKAPGSSKQINLEWADGNTRKWALYKLTTHELALFDDVNTQTIITFSPASSGSTNLMYFHPTWAANTLNSFGFAVAPIFTGSATGVQGLNVSPEFQPSANISVSYANLSINISNPPTGVTITQAIGAYYRNDYKNSVGAITTGINCVAAGVVITGSVKPTTQFGVYCGNQGAAGITTAANLYIDPCSGATNSFDIGFGGSDGTAVGAYFGRIPILYAGLLKYLAVYS
jgi:hypothetical protein